jgi:hypothetical protein
VISDKLGIIVGEAAERYPAPPYTASLVEQVFTNRLIESRRFTGHTLETPRFPFTQESGDTDFVTGASMRVVIINHAHTIILESWLQTSEVSNWQGNIGLRVTVEAEDGSTFQFEMTEGPELFDVGDEFKLSAIQSLEAHAPNGLSFEQRAPNPADPPPGNANESITVQGVASFAGEIAWGFVPFGPDVLDLSRELIWNPLVEGEDPNYLVAALSGVGVLADAGYLTGVAGVAGNAAVAVVKQIAKRVPEPVLREMQDQAGSILGVAQAMATYVSRVPAPPGASVVSSIQNAVSQSAAQVHRLVGSALAIPADKVAAALLMLSNRSGKWFSHDGAEGLAYLLKHERRQAAEALFDEFSDEVVDSTLDVLRFADIPTGSLSDEAIRGAAVAVDTISPGRADSLVEFFRGTQIIGNGDRQRRVLESYSELEGVQGLDQMVDFIRRNASNADGVDGAIYEATASARLRRGDFEELGSLQQIAADGEEVTRSIDAITSTHALQMKSTRSTHFTPSMVGGESYLDQLQLQARNQELVPALITNKPISEHLQQLLEDRGIQWKLIEDAI